LSPEFVVSSVDWVHAQDRGKSLGKRSGGDRSGGPPVFHDNVFRQWIASIATDREETPALSLVCGIICDVPVYHRVSVSALLQLGFPDTLPVTSRLPTLACDEFTGEITPSHGVLAPGPVQILRRSAASGRPEIPVVAIVKAGPRGGLPGYK
jgi:hypothetical protein